MLWKVLKYSLSVVVVVVAAVGVCGWLNTSVSLSYAREQQRTEREHSELLRQFVMTLNRGAKRSEITQLVNQNFGKGHVIKEEQDRILVDDIVFRFDNTQLLSKVQFLGAEDQ